jgi:geranylgeranyl pyrophosphate synthase
MVNDNLTSVTFFDPVLERIQLVETRMRAISDAHHPDLRAALDHLLTSGGKRIRPAVALLTGEMLGADQEKIITLSAAIELLHTATLVHDDLIDGSFLRRGIPTLNARWTPAATVLTGDYIFACAAKLASETGSVDVMHQFAETLSTIVNGEIKQLFNSRSQDYRLDYMERINAKTASMFVLATSAAALLSPKGDQTLRPVSQYGYGIGMAFQIIDDVLDFTGQQATIGKPVASDLRQGLVTLPTIYYLEEHPDDPDLKIVLTGVNFNNERIDRVIREIQESGAILASVNEAKRFVGQANAALDDLPKSSEKQALVELANYIIDRHR